MGAGDFSDKSLYVLVGGMGAYDQAIFPACCTPDATFKIRSSVPLGFRIRYSFLLWIRLLPLVQHFKVPN
jgi:hypothetical protein